MSKKALKGAIVGFLVGGPAGAITGFTAGTAKDVYDLQKDAKKQAKQAQRDARQARIDALKDRKTSSNAGTSPRQIIYGKTRSGGQIVLEESSGTDSEFMHMILVFAAHPCEEIGDIYVDDQRLFAWNGSSHVAQGGFAGKVDIWTRSGNQTGAMPEAVSNIPSWTNSDQLLGQTYIYLRFRYDEDIWDNLRLNISAVIKGKNDILDPRTGLTGWTDNQALCTLDYLRWDRGMNIPDSLINFDSFSNAADIADQLVSAGAGKTEKRYTVNGTQAFDSPPLEVLASLESAGAMSCVRTGKNWSAVAGIYDAGELELNSDDLIGGIEFSPRPDKSGIANISKGTYVDPAQNYEAVDFVHLVVDSYIQSDREELAQDIDFPWTDSGTRARRLSKIYLEQTRYGLVVGCTMKFRAIDLAPGMRVKMTIPELGWNQRVFRVERMAIDIGAGIRLALREDAPEIWSWTEGEALEVDVPPALNVPDPRFTPAPTDLSVTEELYSGAEAGSVRVRAILSWQAGGVSSRAYDVQFKLATATRWNDVASDLPVGSTQIDDLEPGLFDFRVRARNGIGVYSAWAEISYQVIGKTAPPQNIQGLVASQLRNGVRVQWQPVNDLDLAVYEVRENPVFGSEIGLVYRGESTFFLDQPQVSRTYYAAALDTSGNYSAVPAVFAYQAVAPANVGGLQAIQTKDGVRVQWQASGDADFRFYEIRENTSFGSDEGLIYRGEATSILNGPAISRVYYAAAANTSGLYSATPAMISFQAIPPAQTNSLIANVIDNNVLLRWAESSSIYPIRNYRVYRGDVFATAAFVGESSGTFEVVVEQDEGAFRYWVEPVDIAGNRGEPRSVIAPVDNPPDYILRRDDYLDLESFARTNVALGSGGGGLPWDDTQLRWDDEDQRWDNAPSPDLIGPVNTTESFAQNMARSGLGASTPRWDDLALSWDDETLPWGNTGIVPYGQKLANGFLHWLQPADASGFAEKVIDFGALIPSTRITLTLQEDDLVGDADVQVTISTSADNVIWTDFDPGQNVVSASNFRYVRVRLDFSGSGGIAIIQQIRLKLDIKQKTDQGVAEVFASDVDGTEVFMNKAFLDIDSVTATPKAVDAKIAVAEFEDTGNQDRFKVRVFDRATGSRVNAIISWIVRGS